MIKVSDQKSDIFVILYKFVHVTVVDSRECRDVKTKKKTTNATAVNI